MSNVIRFLEVMGSRQLSAAEYAASVAALEVNASQRQALLDRDHAALSDLLSGPAKRMMLVVFAAEEDPTLYA